MWACLAVFGALLAGSATAGTASAQTVSRIVDQDPELNNLVDPPGYVTGELGALGRVERKGSGPQAMLLIPGLGFGGDVFDSFMPGFDDELTRYVVTLPGFGGTAAPPSPSEGAAAAAAWRSASVLSASRRSSTACRS